jgi:hypothetical protein
MIAIKFIQNEYSWNVKRFYIHIKSEKMHIKFFFDMINGCYIRFCDPCRRRRVDDFEGPRRKRPRGDFEREGMCTVVFSIP